MWEMREVMSAGVGTGAEPQELCRKQLRENEAFRMLLDINY